MCGLTKRTKTGAGARCEGEVGRIALSTGPEQKYLYVCERSTSKIRIFDRKTLTMLGEFGDGPGRAPGQFYVLHDLRVDSHGNVYAFLNCAAPIAAAGSGADTVGLAMRSDAKATSASPLAA